MPHHAVTSRELAEAANVSSLRIFRNARDLHHAPGITNFDTKRRRRRARRLFLRQDVGEIVVAPRQPAERKSADQNRYRESEPRADGSLEVEIGQSVFLADAQLMRRAEISQPFPAHDPVVAGGIRAVSGLACIPAPQDVIPPPFRRPRERRPRLRARAQPPSCCSRRAPA